MSIEFTDFADLQLKLDQIRTVEQGRRDAISAYLSQFGLQIISDPFSRVYIDLANVPASFEFEKLDEISKPYDLTIKTIGVIK